MRFREATIETSGCSSEGEHVVAYPNTLRLTSKKGCPKNHYRCCFFCNEHCISICVTARVLQRKTLISRKVTGDFNCKFLSGSLELAWKYLLG